MRIDILYFSGCPNYEATIELIREVVREEGIEARIESIEIRNPDEAARARFVGSPSVRINGQDVEPFARGATGHTMSCRVYGETGIPPRDLLEAALRAAQFETEESEEG